LQASYGVPEHSPCAEEGQEMVTTSAPTPVRTDPPPSKGKGTEGPSLHRRIGERSMSNEALRPPTVGGSRESQWATQLVIRKPSVNTQA